MKVFVFIIFQIFFQHAGKNVYEQLTIYCVRFSLYSVLWYDFVNICPFYNNHKTLSF